MHDSATTREQIAAKANRLAAVDAQIAKLQEERESLITWFEGRPGGSTVERASTAGRAKKGHAGSFATQVVEFLEKEPSRSFTQVEVRAAIGAGKSGHRIRSSLWDLLKRGKIRRPSEGHFQALE